MKLVSLEQLSSISLCDTEAAGILIGSTSNFLRKIIFYHRHYDVDWLNVLT